jgi:hypothetical protein
MTADLEPGDERLAVRAKQVLDRSVVELDATTTLRLQRARLAALEAKPAHRWWMVWASGLAMAAVGALTISLWTKQPIREKQEPQFFEDLDLVLSVENVELAEDLEFYHWLAEDDATG